MCGVNHKKHKSVPINDHKQFIKDDAYNKLVNDLGYAIDSPNESDFASYFINILTGKYVLAAAYHSMCGKHVLGLVIWNYNLNHQI